VAGAAASAAANAAFSASDSGKICSDGASPRLLRAFDIAALTTTQDEHTILTTDGLQWRTFNRLVTPLSKVVLHT
jgi:hypothetical protein